MCFPNSRWLFLHPHDPSSTWWRTPSYMETVITDSWEGIHRATVRNGGGLATDSNRRWFCIKKGATGRSGSTRSKFQSESGAGVDHSGNRMEVSDRWKQTSLTDMRMRDAWYSLCDRQIQLMKIQCFLIVVQVEISISQLGIDRWQGSHVRRAHFNRCLKERDPTSKITTLTQSFSFQSQFQTGAAVPWSRVHDAGRQENGIAKSGSVMLMMTSRQEVRSNEPFSLFFFSPSSHTDNSGECSCCHSALLLVLVVVVVVEQRQFLPPKDRVKRSLLVRNASERAHKTPQSPVCYVNAADAVAAVSIPDAPAASSARGRRSLQQLTFKPDFWTTKQTGDSFPSYSGSGTPLHPHPLLLSHTTTKRPDAGFWMNSRLWRSFLFRPVSQLCFVFCFCTASAELNDIETFTVFDLLLSCCLLSDRLVFFQKNISLVAFTFFFLPSKTFLLPHKNTMNTHKIDTVSDVCVFFDNGCEFSNQCECNAIRHLLLILFASKNIRFLFFKKNMDLFLLLLWKQRQWIRECV